MNKPTEEKTYLRILVNLHEKNINRHSYIFEQWEGEYLNINFKFKRVQYSTNNRYEAKIMMGLLGLKKIKKYKVFMFWDCLIEFED